MPSGDLPREGLAGATRHAGREAVEQVVVGVERRQRLDVRAAAHPDRLHDLAAGTARRLGTVGGTLVAVQLQHRQADRVGRLGDVIERGVDEYAGDLDPPLDSGGDLGLSALVEVHDERELDVVLELGAAIIGINNRDLKTLVVDTRRTFELLPRATGQALIVSESGFSRPEQLDELAEAGVDGVLVGEALMRSPDVEAACRVLTAR